MIKQIVAAPERVATSPTPSGLVRAGWIVPAYLTVQAVLLAGSFVLRPPVNIGVAVLLSSLAWVALYVGVRRTRPQPVRAWRLILVGVALVIVSNIGFALVVYYPWVPLALPLAILLRFIRYGVIGVALWMLGRTQDRRTGLADLLDACIAAMGGFLLIWSSLVEPSLARPNLQPVPLLIITPVLVLGVLAILTKMLFSGVVRTPAMVLLSLAVLSTTASPLIALIPLGTSPMAAVLLAQLMLLLGITMFGAVGLSRSLARAAERPPRTAGDLSRRRALLFAVLALIGPLTWLSQVQGAESGNPVVGLTPIIASGLLGLLLVARLTLMADAAQQRAGELATQAEQLHTAVRRQEALQQQLTHRALHDPLTGLANRVVLVDRLQAALQPDEASRNSALLLLDLDGFKDVNDTFGHPVGDEVLIQIARRLGAVMPPQATLARLGGDEFAVLLPYTDPAGVRGCADAVRSRVSQPLHISGQDVFLTVSIGVFLSGDNGPTTPSAALRDADLALYAAKNSGKNTVVVFETRLRTAQLDRSWITSQLRRPVDVNNFRLDYQPVVALATEQVIAVEALLRWAPDGDKLIPPTMFVPIAEDIDAITPLGAWVLEQACTDATPWYRDHGVALAVNISGRQLENPGFVDLVVQTLAGTGLPPAGLILELTETTLAGTSAVTALRDLRAHGVRIAVDDFGTGYSSLAYLFRLPVDIIKLDRSLAPGNIESPDIDAWASTRAILHLIDSLGLTPIAEGIETPQQREILLHLRCPYAQGYLFAEPTTAAAITATLLSSARHTGFPVGPVPLPD